MLIWRVIGGPGGTPGAWAVGQRPGAGARGDGGVGGAARSAAHPKNPWRPRALSHLGDPRGGQKELGTGQDSGNNTGVLNQSKMPLGQPVAHAGG